MDLIQIGKDNGWWVVLFLFAIDKLWPFFEKHIFPSISKNASENRRRMDDEIVHQRQLEERRVNAMENLSKSVEHALKEMAAAMQQQNQQVALALTINSERLAALQTTQIAHDDFTRSAVGDMRIQVAKGEK